MVLHFVKFLVRHRWVTILCVIASLAVSGYAARTIRIRFQYRDFYDYPGNPRVPLFDNYTAAFGDPAGFVVLLVEAPDVFQPNVLRYVADLTDRLGAMREFSDVKSIANARSIRARGDDVESGPVMDRLPETPAQVEDLRRTTLQSAMLVRRIVSADSTATAILAQMRTPAAAASVEQQKTAVEAAKSLVSANPAPPGVRLRVTGAPVVEVETTLSLVRGQRSLTPLVILVVVAALIFSFRSVQGVLLPLSAVVVSVVWTAGVYSLFGRPLDIIGSSFPTILLVYGVVDPIFVYTRYRAKLDRGLERHEALFEALGELLLPCLLTSLTTALGFAAFSTATLPTVRNFGLILAIGVSLAFVTTITVLPVLLALVPPPRATQSTRISQVLDTTFVRLWRVVGPRRHAVIVGACVAIAIGAFAGAGLDIVNTHVGVLPNGETKDAIRTLEQKLSGVVRFIVYLEGPDGSMKRPDVLQAIDEIDKLAERQPIVDSSISLADLVADANQAFHDGDPNEHRVPASASLIAQYLALLDTPDRADFVSDDYSKSHIRILITDHGSLETGRLRKLFDGELKKRFPPLGIHAELTGNSVVSYIEVDRIVVEVLWGFVAAFVIIVLLEWAVFRSLQLALLSVIPNLVPAAACFATMRLLGVHLRVDNSLVLCVSIGGLFNTTIHIMARSLQQLREGAVDLDAIIEQSLRAVGPPSLYTACILSAGFAVLTLAPFPGLKMMGLLTMVTLMTGLLSDATVTPALMRSTLNWNTAAHGRPRAVEGAATSAVARSDGGSGSRGRGDTE